MLEEWRSLEYWEKFNEIVSDLLDQDELPAKPHRQVGNNKKKAARKAQKKARRINRNG